MRLGRLSRRHPAPQQAESRREINKANRIPPLERRTVPDNMRLLQAPQLLQVFFHLGLVALAGMSHPFPSRTRPLSSPVAMILRSRAWESSALPVLFSSPGPVGILHRRAPGFFLPHGNACRTACRAATEGVYCRPSCAAPLAARIPPRRRPVRVIFASREGAKARRRLFYPQITQINADFGVVSCRSAAIHAADRELFCEGEEGPWALPPPRAPPLSHLGQPVLPLRGNSRRR